jgi:asparagine synthase (glutamine-hydrolysing)
MQRLPAIPRVARVSDGLLAGGSTGAMWLAKRGLFSEAEVKAILSPEAYAEASQADAIARIESLDAPHDVSFERQVGFYELSVYMHDQLLRDTDVMSMAHALEVRVPLIARPVVETVARLGTSALTGNHAKWMLRRIVGRHVPEHLFDGPKRGFTLNWPAMLAEFPAPPNAIASGLVRNGVMQREREAMRLGRVGFARYFALIVVDRLFGRAYATAR